MKIGMDLSPESVTRVSTCVKFAFECSKKWLELQPTDHRWIRHCNQCEKSVFWADTEKAALAHARLGRCVALKREAMVMIGKPASPRPNRLWLMFDWGRGYLWPATVSTQVTLGNGPLEDQLPLLPATRQRLQLLSDWHTQSLNSTDPSEPGPWTMHDHATFEDAVADVLELVQQDLGETFRVDYVRL